MLLAARALGEEAKNTTLTVNGQQQQGQLMQSLSAADLQGRRDQDRQHGRQRRSTRWCRWSARR